MSDRPIPTPHTALREALAPGDMWEESLQATGETRPRAEIVALDIPKERIAALFDGVVAITATLLILDIAIPQASDELTREALMSSAREIAHWIVSFVMVAVIWTEFHVVFSHSKRWDFGLLIGTFVQLALISLIPFASQVMGEYPDSAMAALIFAAVMGGNGLLVSANLAVLERRTHLHTGEESRHHLRRRRRSQLVIYPLGIVVSVGAATAHDPSLGVLAWIVCPVLLVAYMRHVGRRQTPPSTEKEAGHECA